MSDRTYNILFLCTGNSARSVLAEVLMNRLSNGRFQAYSAGSHPAGEVNPFTLELLHSKGFATDGLRSKNWDEFAGPNAPAMDFVITVCDKAAGEVCPIWPGQPMTAHWGLPDPAAATGTEVERRLAFSETYRMLRNRIQAFVNLPIASLDRMSLTQKLRAIGQAKSGIEHEPV